MADYGRGSAWGQPERMLEALAGFREAAEAAAVAWGHDITVQQGLDIAWTLGTVIRDFRIATERLSEYEVTVDPADDDAVPNHEIRQASRCLDAARELASAGEPAMKLAMRSNLERGVYPGGDPDTGGAAVAAVHAMVSALGVSDSVWRVPAGTWEARDKVVTEMMQAMDAFGTAVLVLAEGAPDPFQASLVNMAVALDTSFGHLRESLIISATGYLPGTEWIADAVRAAHPLRFTHQQAPGNPVNRGSAPAADLAGESFPVAPHDTPAALAPTAPDSPRSSAAAGRAATGYPGSARKGPG